MTAALIDGKALAQKIRNTLREKIAKLPATPILAVILVGNNAASQIYVRAKEKACQETGIKTQTIILPDSITQQQLLETITELNINDKINGILVQLPLPKHLDEKTILSAISPIKDIDGFHPLNTGLMIQKIKDTYLPCTPKGIIYMLHSLHQNLEGLHAVVIGRSQIVGIPTAHLLLNENCTVTVAHSRTKNLAEICRSADILIVAVGKPELITKDYIKPNAIIIDVGINRTENGLKGDVCFADAAELASYITPVPGGVGPMTIAMLLENTYEAFLKQNNS